MHEVHNFRIDQIGISHFLYFRIFNIFIKIHDLLRYQFIINKQPLQKHVTNSRGGRERRDERRKAKNGENGGNEKAAQSLSMSTTLSFFIGPCGLWSASEVSNSTSCRKKYLFSFHSI